MQFHLEVTVNSVMELTRHYASDLSQTSDCVQTVEQISENITTRVNQLHQTSGAIYHRWLSVSGSIKR